MSNQILAGAASLIAPKLDRKLRDHILSSKDQSLFQTGSTARPLLAIVDRAVDITSQVCHSWIFQSLVYDALDVHLNQITVEVSDDNNSVKKNFDLKSNDAFWAKHASDPFPTAAQEIDIALSKYKDEAAEIKKKTGASSLEDLQGESGVDAQRLKTALTLLPEVRLSFNSDPRLKLTQRSSKSGRHSWTCEFLCVPNIVQALT